MRTVEISADHSGEASVPSGCGLRWLLEQCSFANVHVRYLAHYLFPASALHGLSTLPLVGRYFRARLFLTCRTAAHA